jgi:hypothetical protein
VPILGRKLQRERWDNGQEGIAPGEIPADAITLDLKTEENALSFWEFDNVEEALRETALAFSSACGSLSPVGVALIERSKFDRGGLALVASPGDTRVPDLVDKHRDCRGLDGSRLLAVARVVTESLSNERNFYRFTRDEVKKLLGEAIAAGRLTASDLKPELWAAVQSPGRTPI